MYVTMLYDFGIGTGTVHHKVGDPTPKSADGIGGLTPIPQGFQWKIQGFWGLGVDFPRPY
jgi:hypothetical protein